MKKLGNLITVLLIAGTLAACRSSAPSFRGTLLDPPRPVPDFTLTDQRGQPFRLSDQRGRVVLLFFGYTYCPDVCPTTLGVWKKVHEELGEEAQQVQFAFVTVDPERDTPERLGEHVARFNPDFLGLTGTPDELEPVYRTFGVYYEKDTATESAAGYLVNHTALIFVVDRDGRWRLHHSFGTPAEEITHDVRQLLKEAAPRIRVQDPWARPGTAMGAEADDADAGMGHGQGGTSAIYLQLTNEGREADQLVSARTDVAQVVEIHETKIEDDVMRMQQLPDGLAVPAGGRVELEPGGYHLMLIDLQQDLTEGETFAVTLTFARSGELTIQVPVRQP